MEFNKENLEYVIHIFKVNDVSYNKRIEKYFNNPASEIETENLANDFFDLLYDVAIDIVNNSAKENKKEIFEITDYIVSQTDSKALKNIKDSQKALIRLQKKVNVHSFENENNFILDFNKFIESIIKASKLYLEKVKILDQHKAILEDGIALLEEIKEDASKILDYSSKDARSLEEEAYSYINEWSEMVAGRRYTDNSKLLKAKDAIQEWKSLVKYNPQKEKTAPFKLALTDIERVENALIGALNDYEGIKTSFEYTKEEFKSLEASYLKIKSQIDNMNDEKARLDAEIDNVAAQFENGEISEDTAENKIMEINEKIAFNDKNIAIQRLSFGNLEASYKVQRQNITIFEAQFANIDLMAQQPLYFYIALKRKNISMDLIKNYFANKLTREEAEEVSYQIQQLLNAYNDVINLGSDVTYDILKGFYKDTINVDKDINKIKENDEERNKAKEILKNRLKKNTQNENINDVTMTQNDIIKEYNKK